MSNMIITDYMAGQIGDKYYEIVGEEPEFIGVVNGIDHLYSYFRYSIAKGCNDIRWHDRGKFDHFEREAPQTVDGMERITDIKKVKPGDIEVAKSGNRYKVVRNESASDTFKLKVTASELGDSEMWLSDFEFAYALRPKSASTGSPTMSDYKDRMVTEYFELKDRTSKLRSMLRDCTIGQLDFEPTCSFDLLSAQLCVMEAYESILAERARIENVDLKEES
jgi:hypothetical protein